MPLLFWYFPLIVFSGAYEAYFSDADNAIEGSQPNVLKARETGILRMGQYLWRRADEDVK
jgi:hypothetical protein